MFKLAKKEEIKETIDVSIIECFINGRDVKRLNFTINDTNNQYSLSFIVNEDIEYYKNLPKYETINVDANKIFECYFTVDGITDVDTLLKLTLVRVGDIVTLIAKFESHDYYGDIEFDYDLKSLKNS